MNRVLITGGAGFIGSHFVEELVNQDNCEIVVVDNLSTGKLSNIEKYLDRIYFVKGDILDLPLMREIFKHRINTIIHLAAELRVPVSIEKPEFVNEVNVNGTINLLNMAGVYGSEFIFASSCAVYGKKNSAVSETSVTSPISPYGVSKLSAEYYIKCFSKLYGINSLIFRFFNVYGNRQNADSPYSGVISVFLKNMKANKICKIYGTGRQCRDFVYVKDLVRAVMKVHQSRLKGCRIFNIGTGEATSINKLFKILKNKLNYKLDPVYEKEREGEIFYSKSENTEIRKYFSKFKNLDQGLEELIR